MSVLQGKPILGNIDVASLFLGENEVGAVYIGSLQIWPINGIDPNENTLFTEPNKEGAEYPYVDETGLHYIDSDNVIYYNISEDSMTLDKESEISWYIKTEKDGESGGIIEYK